MDFKTAVTTCLKLKFADFNGRARRSEFWYFWLFCFVVSAVLTALLTLLGNIPIVKTIAAAVTSVVSLILLIPCLAVLFRRLHDTGKSGWWILLGFIPAIGEIILLVLAAIDSKPEENSYGKCPK